MKHKLYDLIRVTVC